MTEREREDEERVARISAHAANETQSYLRSRAMVHLESAIASMLGSRTCREVAAVLRQQAEHLEQFG